MTAFIDPPDPWDSLKTWRTFRRSLDRLDQENPIVRRAIADADTMIAERERAKRLD